MVPKGRTKRRLCCSLAIFTMGLVLVSSATVFYFIKKFQDRLVDRYVVARGVNDLRVIMNGVANIKQVDLQEIFREVNLLNSLINFQSLNPHLVSEEYRKSTLENKIYGRTRVIEE